MWCFGLLPSCANIHAEWSPAGIENLAPLSPATARAKFDLCCRPLRDGGRALWDAVATLDGGYPAALARLTGPPTD